MLPKKYRLAGAYIPTVLTSGIRFHGSIAYIILIKAKDKTQLTRLTTIVPVRVAKKAVERNRTKRLIREAIHYHINTLKPGFNGIVMAKKSLYNKKLTDIQPSISRLLRKSGLINI